MRCIKMSKTQKKNKKEPKATITEITLNNKEYREVKDLKPWANNPKKVSDEGLERLISQIKELGEYKPLLVEPDGTVIGGNQRLKAYRKLGYTKVWISVVNPKSDAERIKYAISDNDSVGEYIEDPLKKLMANFESAQFKNYAVNLGDITTLDTFIKVQKQLDEDLAVDESLHEHDLSVFLEGSIKQIVLYFDPKGYEQVLDRLAGVMNDFKVESHTEGFMKLLEYYESRSTKKA